MASNSKISGARKSCIWRVRYSKQGLITYQAMAGSGTRRPYSGRCRLSSHDSRGAGHIGGKTVWREDWTSFQALLCLVAAPLTIYLQPSDPRTLIADNSNVPSLDDRHSPTEKRVLTQPDDEQTTPRPLQQNGANHVLDVYIRPAMVPSSGPYTSLHKDNCHTVCRNRAFCEWGTHAWFYKDHPVSFPSPQHVPR